MFKIKTVADLERFKESGLFSPAYCKAVEEYFWQLIKSLLPPGVEAADYSLEDEGYLVVLQIDDDPHNLSSVGLPDGLVNSFPGPEWVEMITLSDHSVIFRMMYLYDNDFAMIFYLDSRLWPEDSPLHSFIAEQLEYESSPDEAVERSCNHGC